MLGPLPEGVDPSDPAAMAAAMAEAEASRAPVLPATRKLFEMLDLDRSLVKVRAPSQCVRSHNRTPCIHTQTLSMH